MNDMEIEGDQEQNTPREDTDLNKSEIDLSCSKAFEFKTEKKSCWKNVEEVNIKPRVYVSHLSAPQISVTMDSPNAANRDQNPAGESSFFMNIM